MKTKTSTKKTASAPAKSGGMKGMTSAQHKKMMGKAEEKGEYDKKGKKLS